MTLPSISSLNLATIANNDNLLTLEMASRISAIDSSNNQFTRALQPQETTVRYPLPCCAELSGIVAH